MFTLKARKVPISQMTSIIHGDERDAVSLGPYLLWVRQELLCHVRFLGSIFRGFMMNRFTRWVAVCVLLGTTSQITRADFLNATTRNWYLPSGVSEAATPAGGGVNNNNYIAGRINYFDDAGTDLGLQDFRNFFIFDLTSVTNPVTSAKLHLYNNGFVPSFPGYGFESPNPFETYKIFDVNTPLASLVAGTGGTTAYADIGTGTSYGTYNISNADRGQFVVINLNAAGLAAINANLGGKIAFGGAITTLSPVPEEEQFAFAVSHNPAGVNDGNTFLEVNAVPAPPAVILLCLGLLGFAGFRVRGFSRKEMLVDSAKP
jgi:hypothetical protein